MNSPVELWMPAVLSLFGTLIVVVLTAWLNTRALSAQVDSLRTGLHTEIEALRAEMRQGFAELRLEFHQQLSEVRLEFHQQLSELNRRVHRLEEARGLVRP